jgi:hypothetical protein
MRIRDAHKHMDPDLDPEHWYKVIKNSPITICVKAKPLILNQCFIIFRPLISDRPIHAFLLIYLIAAWIPHLMTKKMIHLRPWVPVVLHSIPCKRQPR